MSPAESANPPDTKAQPARVLQLALSFRPGGRRRAIETLAGRLRGQGVRCSLACLDELGCEREEINGLFDDVVCLNRRGLLDSSAVRRLGRLIEHNKVNVLHTHDAASQLVGALARVRRPRLRLLMTFHRSLPIESATRRARVRNAMATAMCQAVVVGSRERREHFLAANWVAPEKVVRIPFGADTGAFAPDAAARRSVRERLGVGDETLVLGAVGHFGEEKGIDLAVRSYAQWRGRTPAARAMLVVCGDGSAGQRRAIEALAPREADIRFVGFQRNIAEWMQAFDIFMHAPRQEAFGLVLIEAMAAGLPVAATAVGGVPDIVRNGRTGLLAPPEDVDALAAAIDRLAGDAAARREMGDEARRVATGEYDARLYASRHVRLYGDLLERRPPRGVDESEAIPELDLNESNHRRPSALTGAGGR